MSEEENERKQSVEMKEDMNAVAINAADSELAEALNPRNIRQNPYYVDNSPYSTSLSAPSIYPALQQNVQATPYLNSSTIVRQEEYVTIHFQYPLLIPT